MGRRRSQTVLVTRVRGTSLSRQPDELIVEEPMEIHLDGVLVSTTMRTPGHDYELAAGYCLTEGLLGGAAVTTVRYCALGSAVDSEFNVVTVDTGGKAPTPTPRLATTSSSCGLCGSASLTSLAERLDPLSPDLLVEIPLTVLASVPDAVTRAQDLFTSTGAVHAAAAFTPTGEILTVREDVGRHNAVDKVVGKLLLDRRLPAHDLGLYVSGRASFEIIQKAWAAGFGSVIAVSAPTALSVETAKAAGITLAGFLRGDGFNVYSPAQVPPVA
jgi:FdhD protein